MLQAFANDAGLHVHLDAHVPGKSGNPHVLVKRASAIAQKRQRGRGNSYATKYVILDTDWLSPNEADNVRLQQEAAAAGLNLVFQDCCFEAFLLRHFEQTQTAAPPTAQIALQQINSVWDGYRKGLSASDLMKRLNVEMVRAAAQRPRKRDFESLLRDIGLI